MNERIKELRKHLGLTLDKFGERIGVTKSTISNIENGYRNPTEHMIKSICREFNVCEEWLRYGVGPMMVQPEDELASIVVDILSEDNPFFDLIKGILRTYDAMDEKSKRCLEEFAKKLADNLKREV